jgi:hypothetical protein
LEIIWHRNCLVLDYSFIQSGSFMNTSLRSFAVKTTFAAVTALAFAASASATTLTTKLAVDNGFTAYLSTSDSSTGTQFSVGHDWPTVVTGTVELGTAAKYFLQVAAYDDGGSAGLLGEFSLAGTGYHFADGSTTVLTGSNLLSGNVIGFNGAYSALWNIGQNGVQPWNTVAGIDAAAQWVWSGANDFENFTFLSLEILADAPADVPEPASLGLMGLGLLALSRIRARKSQ